MLDRITRGRDLQTCFFLRSNFFVLHIAPRAPINKFMRLSELTGYKNLPQYKTLTADPSIKQFVDAAEQKGWVMYGAGQNGVALRNPGKDYIYKIFTSRSEHIGYHAWVNWVIQHPNNPYVPKISRPILIPNTAHGPAGRFRRDIYFVRVEVLDPARGENDPRFERYISKTYDRTNPNRFFRNFAAEPTLFDHAKGSLYDNDPAFKEIWNFASDQLDLGIDNVMFRGNQLVLTDPMA